MQISIFWSGLQPSEDTVMGSGMQTYMKYRDGVVALICMRKTMSKEVLEG